MNFNFITKLWKRTGTVLEPVNAGDDITTTGNVTGKDVISTGAGGTLTLDTTTNSLSAIKGSGVFYAKPENTLVGWFDQTNAFNAYAGKYMKFGESSATGTHFRFRHDLAQHDGTHLVSTFMFGLMDQIWASTCYPSRAIIFCDTSDIAFNFAHAPQTNPTIFIHAAEAHVDKWLSLAHNGTSGVIAAGGATGALALGAANTDTISCVGRLIPRTTASDPQHVTAGSRPAGSVGEIAFYSGKLYLCTDATPGTPVWEKITSA